MLLMLLTIIAIVALIVLVRMYHLMLQNRQLTLLVEERRLLIERGVTDLPPLELPEMRTKKPPRSLLITGVVLLCVSVAWIASGLFLTRYSALGHPGVNVGVALGPGVLIGALGLLLLLIYAILGPGHHERRDSGEQELPGSENASVIEVDTEE